MSQSHRHGTREYSPGYTDILGNYKPFISNILTSLHDKGIDVSNLVMDHIGYQASSDVDYDSLKSEFDRIGLCIKETTVNGRRVGIYKLFSPLTYDHYRNTAIELYAPKKGQICSSGLEHVEFVIDDFDTFLQQYPKIPWDLSAISQKDFPQIKLPLENNTQVKFHLHALVD